MRTRPKREITKKVSMTLRPSVIKKLDEMAKDMGVTRSGVVTHFAMMSQALDDNKALNKLMESMIMKAIKASKQ